MPKMLDLSGKRFGSITVLSNVPPQDLFKKAGPLRVLCDCGTEELWSRSRFHDRHRSDECFACAKCRANSLNSHKYNANELGGSKMLIRLPERLRLDLQAMSILDGDNCSTFIRQAIIHYIQSRQGIYSESQLDSAREEAVNRRTAQQKSSIKSFR